VKYFKYSHQNNSFVLYTNGMIIRKKKKCIECGDETYIFSRGRCKVCASKQNVSRGTIQSGSSELNRWFSERRLEMTGKCQHCGKSSCNNSDQYFKFSIAHILPKKIFKSVATHPLNWVELCFWSPSCHTNYDNFSLDITELNCFDLVIERFIEIYPHIAVGERKNIPDVLLQYIKIQQDI
jgi:hypothetical protein